MNTTLHRLINIWVTGLNKARPALFALLILLIGAATTVPMYAAVAQAEEQPVIGSHPSDALPVTFMNRHIFTIRSGIMGFTQEERRIGISCRIKVAMEKSSDDHVLIRPTSEGGRIIELNGVAVFQLRPGDLDPVLGQSMDEAVTSATENLKIAVREAREQGNSKVVLKGIGFTLLASAFFYLACRFIYWGQRSAIRRLKNWLDRWDEKLAVAIHPQQVSNALFFTVDLSKWTLIVTAGYEWATFCLSQFPYSRPWGEKLHSFLIETLQGILSAIIGALPGLLVVFVIVLLTRFTSQILKAFFARIESGEVTVTWMAEETAKPTRKITQALLWLFAFAMAYPYLPGSNTEAFKGLSVLVGIMLSIGGAGVVGQAASGLIMVYSRVLREGEFVKIDKIEGVVTAVGIFSTKIRTSIGEEVNVPNSLIGNTTTVNSSRLAEGGGLVVNTTVTIGYNTPWRQVHALLLRAAENTPGLRSDPQPFVVQSGLSDFYVEYRLCAQVERPEIRRVTLSLLHANIQDVFNEFGVQIMSPHYVNDPLQKVWVPKEQWFETPAKE